MRYEKLNNRWNAKPNSPNLSIDVEDNCAELTFDLNPFKFNYIDEGDKGSLEFQEVYKFFSGSVNDEGYYKGNHRYTNDQLPWGEFYELFDSNWETIFPKSANIISNDVEKSELRHFIFFLKEQEVECLCEDYFFHFKFRDQELFSEKYPNNSFNHYLAMFGLNQSDSSLQNFENQINIYIEFEGKDEFKDLKDEVTQIIKCNDYNWFLKQAITCDIPYINIERLKGMMDSVVKHSF